jgi:hypothetical protein
MLDPQAVLDQASQGTAPATWRVFTKERGRVRGFLRGTSADPDPLLVITPDGVVEYIDSKKPSVHRGVRRHCRMAPAISSSAAHRGKPGPASPLAPGRAAGVEPRA